jgi:Domain of unknown function (DUF4375)
MINPYEAPISAALRAMTGARPSGALSVEADEGMIGFSGAFEGGLLRRKTFDTTQLPDELPELFSQSYDWSKTQRGGPWYTCTVSADPRAGFSYAYDWQGDAIGDLSRLTKSVNGGVPGFILRTRFDRELLALVDDHEISTAILYFVPAELARGRTVAPELFQLYAVVDWQGDTNNGSLNQYFARAHDPYGGLDRAELYPATLQGLALIGHADAAALFRESLSVYAHFHPRVEQVRARLGLPTISSPEDSNAINAYWDVEATLNDLIVAHVREHIDRLVVAPVESGPA